MRLLRHRPAGGRAVRAGPGRHDVHVRHHAVRRHPPRPRRRRTSPTTSCSGASATSATTPGACATSPTSTTRSSRKARELGVHYLDLAAAETARFDDDMEALEHAARRGASPGPRRPSPTSAASSAWCSTAGHAYQAGGAVYFDVSSFPDFGQCRHYDREQMLELRRRARRQRRRPEQARPARLRALAAVGRRRAVVGVAVGPGPSGLAHRVLGAGPARARHDHRPARRRRRPDLPAPRVRGGPVRGGHRRAVRAPLDAPGDGADGRREDVEVARQPRVRVRPPQGVGRRGDPPDDHREPLPHRVGVGRRPACPRAAERLERVAARRATATAALDEVRAALDDDLDTPGAVAAIDAAAAAGAGRRRPPRLLGVDLRSPDLARQAVQDSGLVASMHSRWPSATYGTALPRREDGPRRRSSGSRWKLKVEGARARARRRARRSSARTTPRCSTRSSCRSCCPGASPTSARPSTWTPGRRSTSSRPSA